MNENSNSLQYLMKIVKPLKILTLAVSMYTILKLSDRYKSYLNQAWLHYIFVEPQEVWPSACLYFLPPTSNASHDI